MKKLTFKSFFTAMYFVFLALGAWAAYKGDWIVAMFWAITCASENIASSIDAWPRILCRDRKWILSFAVDEVKNGKSQEEIGSG